MYPIKFEKHLVKKVWGGREFETILGIPLPENEKIGESWEVSCHKNGLSIIKNGEFKGKTLEKIVKEYKGEILGEEIYDKYGDKFPLLIKFLDINDRLSVQVHPDDKYALEKEGEFGKSECWYILDASSDARLILGIKDGIDRETFIEKSRRRDFTDLFNCVSVKKGDFINITPGLVHASLSGSILLCEIQQNSDTTYRIYDFDRVVDGKLRPLHLDKAYDVIEFDKKPEMSREEDREKIEVSRGSKELLVKSPYFTVEKLKLKGKYRDEKYKNFKIYSVIDGEGSVRTEEKIYRIGKGETLFIPANLEVTLDGNIEILKSYI